MVETQTYKSTNVSVVHVGNKKCIELDEVMNKLKAEK